MVLKVIVIDGNVGVGKSNLLGELRKEGEMGKMTLI